MSPFIVPIQDWTEQADYGITKPEGNLLSVHNSASNQTDYGIV